MWEQLSKKEQDFVNHLISDRKEFENFLYTPLECVSDVLHQRKNRRDILEYSLQHFTEETFLLPKKRNCAVLCRNIATPNFETIYFIQKAKSIPAITPTILEYTTDKYVGINKIKKYLGKICFFDESLDQKKCKSVFNSYQANGISLHKINTTDATPLTDFHHTFFFNTYPEMKENVFDVSHTLAVIKNDPVYFYKKILSLFLKDHVLFENFVIYGYEAEFTRNTVLPAVILIEKEVGVRPIITPLTPPQLEDADFWYGYPGEISRFVNI